MKLGELSLFNPGLTIYLSDNIYYVKEKQFRRCRNPSGDNADRTFGPAFRARSKICSSSGKAAPPNQFECTDDGSAFVVGGRYPSELFGRSQDSRRRRVRPDSDALQPVGVLRHSFNAHVDDSVLPRCAARLTGRAISCVRVFMTRFCVRSFEFLKLTRGGY